MSEERLNRSRETFISIIALAAIAVIIGVIGYMQGHFDLSRYGVVTGDEVAIAGSEGTSNSAFAVSDKFVPLSAAEKYSPDTLYEKINGKAPLYTEAGFEELVTQRFTFAADPEVWIEIYRYRMSTPAAAFYVYSTQKRAAGEPVDDFSGEHFYRTTSGLYLAAGDNYFEISASAESEAVLAALIEDIGGIAALDEPGNELLAIPAFLPDESAVKGSFKMYLDGAFGIGGLGKVYIREYELEGEKLTAFVVEEGQAAMTKFEQFMTESMAEKVDDADGIAVYDLFGVYELLAVEDGLLIGVHEADNEQTAVELIKMIRGEGDNE